MAKLIKAEKVHIKVTGDLVPIGDNVVATLDEQLARKIFQHHASAAENNANKAMYAAAIKKAHSNSATDAMSDTFKSWYKKYKLERAYGTPKNFQHWVKAGQAIERHRKLFGEDLVDLPLQRGISAMEELSGWSDAEIRIAMEHAWKRDNLTTSIEDLRKAHGTKAKKPVIHAGASAGSLKAWKEAWTNPQPKPAKDPHRLNFIEIKAANNVLYFDNKTAKQQGPTTLSSLEAIQSKILEVLKRFEADGHIRITSHLEGVKAAYSKKEQLAKDAAAKASAKKKNISKKSSSKSKTKKAR